MMLQALQRFTGLIDLLARAPAEGLALGAIATASGLPPATCSRALKAMTALGWADQDGNRGSYRLGPRATAMAVAVPYRGRLLRAAVPRLQDLARRHPGTGVSVVTLRAGSRFGLWSQAPEAGAVGRMELYPNADVWGMPSGRLLLALRPPRQRQRWIAALGLPGPEQWPGILTRRELDAALAEIRRERIAQVYVAGSVYVAVPVADGSDVEVVLGCWHAGRRADPGAVRTLRRCAAEVAAELGGKWHGRPARADP